MPRCKKSVMCLREKICVAEKLYSGMRYRHELAVRSMLVNQQYTGVGKSRFKVVSM